MSGREREVTTSLQSCLPSLPQPSVTHLVTPQYTIQDQGPPAGPQVLYLLIISLSELVNMLPGRGGRGGEGGDGRRDRRVKQQCQRHTSPPPTATTLPPQSDATSGCHNISSLLALTSQQSTLLVPADFTSDTNI